MKSINDPNARLVTIQRAYVESVKELLRVFRYCPICGAELQILFKPGDGVVACLTHGDMVISNNEYSLKLVWNSYWVEYNPAKPQES